jgi:DNA-binding winged helix-turn-helix (wHTH) protein
MTMGEGESAASVEFGPFCLVPARRLLKRNGVPVAIGSRALGILICLVERHGEIISKEELMSYVWPNITLDEACLRVHIAKLRKSLGDSPLGAGGIQYIKNVSGRGYCFVAPIRRSPARNVAVAGNNHLHRQAGRPPPLFRIVVRGDVIRDISDPSTCSRVAAMHGLEGIRKMAAVISAGFAPADSFAKTPQLPSRVNDTLQGEVEPMMPIKFTVRRSNWPGGEGETGTNDLQQYVPLFDVEIP